MSVVFLYSLILRHPVIGTDIPSADPAMFGSPTKSHGRTLEILHEEQLSTDDYSNVVYRFKKPWDDGTTALKLTPMELMERLVALVPWPRVHLARYHFE